MLVGKEGTNTLIRVRIVLIVVVEVAIVRVQIPSIVVIILGTRPQIVT